jgi:hypothetical protein
MVVDTSARKLDSPKMPQRVWLSRPCSRPWPVRSFGARWARLAVRCGRADWTLHCSPESNEARAETLFGWLMTGAEM